jgi:hypothetical protein
VIGRKCLSTLIFEDKDGKQPYDDRAESVQKQGKMRGNLPCGQEVLVDSCHQI